MFFTTHCCVWMFHTELLAASNYTLAICEITWTSEWASEKERGRARVESNCSLRRKSNHMTRWIRLQKHAQHLQDQTHSAEWPPILFHTALFVSLLTFPFTFFSGGMCRYHISCLEPHIMLAQRCADRLSFCVECSRKYRPVTWANIFPFTNFVVVHSCVFVFVCAHFLLFNLQNCGFRSCRRSLLLNAFFSPFFFAFTVQIVHGSVSEWRNFTWIVI